MSSVESAVSETASKPVKEVTVSSTKSKAKNNKPTCKSISSFTVTPKTLN